MSVNQCACFRAEPRIIGTFFVPHHHRRQSWRHCSPGTFRVTHSHAIASQKLGRVLNFHCSYPNPASVAPIPLRQVRPSPSTIHTPCSMLRCHSSSSKNGPNVHVKPPPAASAIPLHGTVLLSTRTSKRVVTLSDRPPAASIGQWTESAPDIQIKSSTRSSERSH